MHCGAKSNLNRYPDPCHAPALQSHHSTSTFNKGHHIPPGPNVSARGMIVQTPSDIKIKKSGKQSEPYIYRVIIKRVFVFWYFLFPSTCFVLPIAVVEIATQARDKLVVRSRPSRS